MIGAGASGLVAAGRAAEKGAAVVLLEKMESPAKKILITGKGRCNVTNSAELLDFVEAFGPNGRFLYTAFKKFFREDLLAFLGRLGVQTKAERGGRIFPASDDAGEVARALVRYVEVNGVLLEKNKKVTAIRVRDGRVEGAESEGKFWPANAVILAAGGASWPATGSSGDGFDLARQVGHSITPLRPALVPLIVQEIELARSMQDVSLRNVQLSAYACAAEEIQGSGEKKLLDRRFGEMLFTHFGLAGPIVLLMSKKIVMALEHGPVSVEIDLKPALSPRQLNLRLQREFDRLGKQTLELILKDLLPRKMVGPLAALSGIAADKPANQISSVERERLASLLKALPFNIRGALPLGSAMVTSGGVALEEINPRDMGSRLVAGLYFCGEVMDLDADTGGYNLQAAFSTGYLAGDSAAAYLASLP